MDLAAAKRRARSASAARRDEAHRLSAAAAGAILAARGLPVAKPAGQCAVSAFHAYKNEISTLPLLDTLAAAGWTTALPVVAGPGLPLLFRAWVPGSPTVPGVWDIPMPPEHNAVVEPDVLLVPLLAFDRQGYRLGYGGGFYDRTLAVLRAWKTVVAIGVGYAAQEVPEVPHGPFDQPLDWMMTETESFKCG